MAALIVTKSGEPCQHENCLDDAVSAWRDRLKIRAKLRLYDAGGATTTRLLEAGTNLREIAAHMGWSLKHAADVIKGVLGHVRQPQGHAERGSSANIVANRRCVKGAKWWSGR